MSNDGVRILFATDGSEGAAAALDVLTALPLRPSDEIVVVSYPAYFLAARPGVTGPVARLMEGRRRAAYGIVAVAAKCFAGTGVRTTAIVPDGLDASDAILRVALEQRVDLIVLGSRGLGAVSSLLIGSTARALVILSPVPVLMIRDRRTAPRRVLIAVDGSEASRSAIQLLASLPLPKDLSIELLHVLPQHRWSEIAPGRDREIFALRESFEREEAERGLIVLRESAVLLGDRTVHTVVERGSVSDAILRHAAAFGADLIVLGTRGVTGPRRLLWGSTAERIVVATRCAVLIAPAPADVTSGESVDAEAVVASAG